MAASRNHGEFKALHLLSALILDSQSLVQPIIEKSGANLELIDKNIEEELKKASKVSFGFTDREYLPAIPFPRTYSYFRKSG